MDKASEQKLYRFDDFRLDVATLMLYRGEAEIHLVPKAVKTLQVLVERRGEVVSKEELLEAVWPDSVVEESNLFSYLTSLRRALGDQENGHPYIETFRRRGYRFNADVRLEEKEVPRFDEERVVHNGNLEHKRHPRWRTRYIFWTIVALVFAAVLVAASFYRPTVEPTQPVGTNRPKTIAILPFTPLAPGDRNESLELGMADELILRLASGRSIRVLPLTSVLKFRQPDLDPVETGKHLSVDAVVAGSLQRSGDRIRVRVNLISVADGRVTWAGTFDEPYTKIFDVQNEVAGELADALDLQLREDELGRIKKQYTSSIEAYDYYQLGRYNVYKINEASMRQGIDFYEKAVKTDPAYALAYAELADAYRRLAFAGFARPREVFPKAKVYAAKALQLDSSLAEAQVALGWVTYAYDWDWDAAEELFKGAIKLDPNDPAAHFAYAHFLSDAGKHIEAAASIRIAKELGPTTLITLALESMILNAAGQEDHAVIAAKKTLDFDETFWPAHLQLGLAYYRQKRYSDALVELERARELAPNAYQAKSSLGLVYAVMGNKKRASEILRELEDPGKGYTPFHKIAAIYNALGQKKKALNLLERALDERETHLMDIRIERSFDNLSSEPRFVAVLKKMGLEH